MNAAIQIVPMQEKHISALAQLERLCFLSHGLKTAYAANFTISSLFCVAEQNGQVLGYAGMQCVMGECYINNIAVFPQFRGMGIGTTLVKVLIEQAIQRDGVLFLWKYVFPINKPFLYIKNLVFKKWDAEKTFIQRLWKMV